MRAFKNWFFAWIFPWVPKRLLSRATGVLMRVPLLWPLSSLLLPIFAKIFHIQVGEAEKPIGRYRSFDDFFTRKLKPGLRPIQGAHIHPVDGVLSQAGMISAGELLQAKGWTYPLEELLGGDTDLAKAYAGGRFATYYLCPADYHRVHVPLKGHLVSARHVPGLLWPVNEWSVHNIRRLFCLNERVVLNFVGERGKFTLVMVGATNVGHMTITPDPSIITNRWLWHAPTDRRYVPTLPMNVGDEIGIFHLGSTVICLFESKLETDSPPLGAVKLGQSYLS